MDSYRFLTPIMQGLGVEAKPDPARLSALQEAIQNESDPYMKSLLEGSRPVDDKPGFYWNDKEEMLFKYNPSTDLKPQWLSPSLLTKRAKSMIDPQLLK